MLNFLHKFKYFDIPLQISILLLAIAGLSVLYSTSLPSENIVIFWRQAVFLIAGLAGYVFFSFFDYHALAKANRVVYLMFLSLLVYLLVFGSVIRGGRRWIDFGFFRFQPAEFVKIVVILGLARLLALRRGQINLWKNIGWSLLYVSIPALLVLLEPDMGSTLVILSLWVCLLLISPIKKKYLFALFLAFLVVSGLSWKFLLKDFQRARVQVFLNPSLDPKGKGYNVKQAAIAVGSGQLFGRGLGKGLQSQYKFLPEKQTDFIFAAASEEIGFVGCLALIGLYLFLFLRILKITREARDDLGMYLAGGVFFLLVLHVVVNVGMNVGLLPVTGIPLPFLSSGGSSLIVSLISLGIVQNVAMQSKVLRF